MTTMIVAYHKDSMTRSDRQHYFSTSAAGDGCVRALRVAQRQTVIPGHRHRGDRRRSGRVRRRPGCRCGSHLPRQRRRHGRRLLLRRFRPIRHRASSPTSRAPASEHMHEYRCPLGLLSSSYPALGALEGVVPANPHLPRPGGDGARRVVVPWAVIRSKSKSQSPARVGRGGRKRGRWPPRSARPRGRRCSLGRTEPPAGRPSPPPSSD